MAMRKYVAEFIGTLVLTLVGCGTAMLVGCDSDFGCGYMLTAAAFGLSIVAMAYSIGNISGCHINPAVSLAVWISGGMSAKDFGCYVVAQILGALVAACLLALIWTCGDVTDMTDAFGSNGLSGVNESVLAGLLVEIILTFIFVMVVLGATSKKFDHAAVAGLVIGLSLMFVHIIGIGLTGTSVNPARSIGPAIIAAISGNTDPISCVWIFIVAPLIGGALAAFVYKFLESDPKKND